jgi:hypothetical protein
MTYETERAAIEGRFKTAWDAAYAAMKVGYDGQKFEFIRDTNSVRLTILDGNAEQISFGNPGTNLVRHVGVIMIQIAVPGGAGTVAIRPIADAAMTIFRNQTFGGVRCRIPYVLSRDEEPPFLIWTIACPFERDEHNG